MTSIEKVARAIYAEFENRPLYAQAQMNDVLALELARAAIEAMRKPTEAMVLAAENAELPTDYDESDPYAIYRVEYAAMIDAALKEE